MYVENLMMNRKQNRHFDCFTLKMYNKILLTKENTTILRISKTKANVSKNIYLHTFTI